MCLDSRLWFSELCASPTSDIYVHKSDRRSAGYPRLLKMTNALAKSVIPMRALLVLRGRFCSEDYLAERTEEFEQVGGFLRGQILQQTLRHGGGVRWLHRFHFLELDVNFVQI